MRFGTRMIKNIVKTVAVICIAAMVLIYPSSAKTMAAPAANATIVNVTTYVNIRDKASTSGAVVTTATLGARVAVTATVQAEADDTSACSDWYAVSVVQNGKTYSGYVASKYVQVDISSNSSQPADAAFESAIAGFPDSYKPYLRDLHAKHPQWVFHPENVGSTWSDCLDKETKSGVSLVQNTTDATWQSRSYTGIVDSPNWVNASRALVAYYMDPRNMMSEASVFQFVDLNYTDNSVDPSAIGRVLNNSFMASPNTATFLDATPMLYQDIFAIAGNSARSDNTGINPVFLASHALQECGRNGSNSSNGTNGVYNFYNIGAYSDAIDASRHGLELAANGLDANFNSTYHIPWNTQGLSIVFGAKWIFYNYTINGQDTLYYMRFNVSPDRKYSLCRHQYMTATQSVASEGRRMYEAYKASGLLDSALHFYIPVFDQMPGVACELPSKVNAYNDYINMLYDRLLGRTPAADEVSNYSTMLSNGSSAGDIAINFINSGEFAAAHLSDSDFIKLMYTTFCNREAVSEEVDNMLKFIRDGYSRNYIFTQVINSKECHDFLSYYSVNLATFKNPDLVDNNMNIKPLVVQLYNGVLGRDPDRDGLRNWISQLASGTMSGPQVAAAFCMSPEMDSYDLSNGEFVTRLYRVCLGREPDPAGFADWTGKLEQFYTREFVVSGFVNSEEFAILCARYGVGDAQFESATTIGLSPSPSKIKAFVTRLYNLALGREPDQQGLDNWSNGLIGGSLNGYDVAYGFIFSEEMKVLDLDNSEFLTRMYRIFLDREPDDYGFNYWTERMNNGATRLEIFEGFVYSDEFTDLCVQAGFKPNAEYKIG